MKKKVCTVAVNCKSDTDCSWTNGREKRKERRKMRICGLKHIFINYHKFIIVIRFFMSNTISHRPSALKHVVRLYSIRVILIFIFPFYCWLDDFICLRKFFCSLVTQICERKKPKNPLIGDIIKAHKGIQCEIIQVIMKIW